MNAGRPGPGGPGRAAPRPRRRTAAPLPRLLRSELDLALVRPRTVVVLVTAAVVPVLAVLALAGAGEPLAHALGVLTIAMSEPAAFSLAMPVVLVAADAFATERGRGTLDGLRLSPVGPGRLLLLKASAVLCTAVVTALVVTGISVLVGSVVLGTGPFGAGGTIGRALLLAGWIAVQLTGLGMLLLAVSAAVRRSVAVVAIGLAAVTVAPLAAVVWPPVAPVLPSGHWHEVLAQVMDAAVGTGALWATTARAAGFAVAGAGIVVYLLTRRDG
ncbi:ABC transporter permease [Pseudonocardia sp. HH130630-07]|uniref:ABC transporter permease n=1 Tax=Pseudonocardia sp. HH130630-07 TaxID=1690815 RepID=UPI0018D32901|nr:ABC transporter permease [Pseudonocardia sp. HH130630-07]